MSDAPGTAPLDPASHDALARPATGVAIESVWPWIGLIAFGIAVSWRQLSSWDVWWHLAIGREAVTSGSRLLQDTFSHSFAGAPFVYKDLFADSILYLAFESFGFTGLALVRVAAVVTAGAGLMLVARHGRGSAGVWLLASGLLVLAIQTRVIPRPLLFSVGICPLMLGLIERARSRIDRRNWRPFFLALVPVIGLQWLWLNLHRGGLLGLVLLLGLACATALARAVRPIRFLRRLAGPAPSTATVGVATSVFLIAAALGLANPSGVELYRSGLFVTRNAILQGYISEWQPLSWVIATEYYPWATGLIIAGWLALFAGLASGLRRGAHRPPVDIWHAGVLAVFTWQALESVRWLSYASAAAAVVLLLAVSAGRRAWIARFGGRRVALVALAIVLTAMIAHTSPHRFGLGRAPDRYPAGALDFARSHDLGPRVHNAFVYGGFVAWAGTPDFQVLVDGRNDMVYPPEFFLRCTQAQRSPTEFAALRREFPSDWVLADNTPGRETFGFLAFDEAWMPVYWSDTAVVYVPRPGHMRLAHLEYRYVNPGAPIDSLLAALDAAGDDTARLHLIRAELIRLVDGAPNSVRANTYMVMYYHHLGLDGREPMRAVLDHLYRVAPNHPAVRELRSRFGPI